jgi:hypothetical protein
MLRKQLELQHDAKTPRAPTWIFRKRACWALCAVVLQIIGGIFGALMVAGLVPRAYTGMGDGAPGEAQHRQQHCSFGGRKT